MTRPLTNHDARTAFFLCREADPSLEPNQTAFLAGAMLAEPDADPVTIPEDLTPLGSGESSIFHAARLGALAVQPCPTRAYAIAYLLDYVIHND